MAKKVFLQDQNEKLLPITRGELVLDSSGKEAFHSDEFLANNSQPGLMSKEDKVILDVVKAQSTPVIFGQDTDTMSNWTGISDQITSYEEGITIIYIPTKAGANSSTKLQINDLEPIPVQVSGYSGPFTANVPIFLTYIDGKWQFSDKDTTYTMPYGLYIFNGHNAGVLLFKNAGASQILLKLDRPQYLLLVVATEYTCTRPVEYIAFGNTLTGKLPLLVDGSHLLKGDVFYKGHYIAYCDGETCYINTDGTIPGITEKSLYSEKAALAEKVEWNIVTEGGSEIEELETTVDNAQYLVIHNLGASDRKPETFKPSAITAWTNQEGMPTTQTYSGLNVTSPNPTNQTSWQLCSNASELNYGARLWFRTGIANDWHSWQQVAFTNDLLTHGMGMILAAGEDINSLSTGIYSVENEDVASKIVNAPVNDSGFKLFNFAGYQSPTSYGAQLAFSKDNFYWRLLGQNNQECSDWYYWLKIKKGESVGTPNTPMYIDEAGVPRAINCSIEKSVPANAQFTDTRCTSLNVSLKSEAEAVSDEDEVVGVLKAESINASGDGTYLSGLLSYVNVPTENFVKRTFKFKQEPVVDPTADGVSNTFIDSISQDENGKITVTKKAIQSGSGGGGESSGTVSYVNLTMPEEFAVSGNPITTSGTFNVTLKSEYSIPTTNDVNKWNSYKSNVQADWAAEEGSDAYIQNKPEIPQVGAGVLTIKVNNSEVAQFSANSTENKTVNINTINSIPMASPTDLGGIRLGYNTDYVQKNYKVQVDEYGNAFVQVPWQPGEGSDTKNTAGATDSEQDLFIIGSLDQSDNPQTYSNANIKISGNAIKASGGFYQESDERLKDFTEDIQVDLEQLSQLPKKHFTWKNNSEKETQIGTSAQELQKLYPELVKEDSNGTLSVAYDKLSIIALKAIDELYKRNIELEKRIQELENK